MRLFVLRSRWPAMDDAMAIKMVKGCADLLAQHSKIHLFSVALTCCALLGVLLLDSLPRYAMAALLFAVVLGCCETLLAVRTGFDYRLLQGFYRSGSAAAEKLDRLDEMLTRLRLLPAAKAGRELDARLHGCIGLLKWQGGLTVAQCFLVIMSSVGLL